MLWLDLSGWPVRGTGLTGAAQFGVLAGHQICAIGIWGQNFEIQLKARIKEELCYI
jgi:hypothetical protein